jgi:hypothetical protein
MKKYFACVLITIAFSLSTKAQSPEPPVTGNNPYDYVGSYHNMLLDSFFTEYNEVRARNEKLSADDLKNYIIQKANINPASIVDEIFSHTIFQNTQTTTFTELPNKLEQMHVISVKCGEYLRSLDASIENDLETSYDAFNNSAIQLENGILQDKQLTESEKGILLSSAATARYSAYFWKEVAESMDTKEKGGNVPARLPAWLRSILRADASGAASGAVVGAIVGGTATLGTLTVPGWIVGGLTAGAGSSVTNAVQQLWDYYIK